MPTPYRRRKLSKEPVFEHPPLWIHESVAVLLLARRDARRRALLELIDDVESRLTRPSGRSAPAARRSQS